MQSYFDTSIEYLKGVGSLKADLLKKELEIYTFGDLIRYYPFRYEDRTKIYTVDQIEDGLANIQLAGKIIGIKTMGAKHKKRLVAYLDDGTGQIELTWFKGIPWVQKRIALGKQYMVFGKPNRYGNYWSIAHPELESSNEEVQPFTFLHPVYHTTEKLKAKYIDSKAISGFLKTLLTTAVNHLEENLPQAIIDEYSLISRRAAIIQIHFPKDENALKKAKYRLKFEELFFLQLRLLKMKNTNSKKIKGTVMTSTQLVNTFYEKFIPFELTDAQKRVIKECYHDMKSGLQMNRLVQGDVGSGKTMVAFICILIAISSGTQAAMMAPTEILAEQHFEGLKPYCDQLNLRVRKLTGSTKKKERTQIHQELESGALNILVGTHALLEDKVQFNNLGLAVIDEQHRFGVAQRAKLWEKNDLHYPHVLIMTATPIPRTLAMTLYGDLDVSIIDQMPAGRKPIITKHMYDSGRLKLFAFLRDQINLGRQAYIVYPLIEESATLDYKDLMDGYESIARAFPEFHLSIVHGKMKPSDKDFEMQRFHKKETQILVATTVIEVGVNVPNASVMVIENAERFGLAQLHQLRGRVGRGPDQSYCILMSGNKLSKEARLRIETMVRTNDGFEIADIDMKIRGPGDMMGTQQSGITDLIIADLAKDGAIVSMARTSAMSIIDTDPTFNKSENTCIKNYVEILKSTSNNWSRIS